MIELNVTKPQRTSLLHQLKILDKFNSIRSFILCLFLLECSISRVLQARASKYIAGCNLLHIQEYICTSNIIAFKLMGYSYKFSYGNSFMQHQNFHITVGDIPYSWEIMRTITDSSQVASARLLRSKKRFHINLFKQGANTSCIVKLDQFIKMQSIKAQLTAQFIKYLKKFCQSTRDLSLNGWRISISYV